MVKQTTQPKPFAFAAGAPNGNTLAPMPAPSATPPAPGLGKYAAATAKLGGAHIVPAFKFSNHHLVVNPVANRAPTTTSVMGKVCAGIAQVQAANGGKPVTGAALVQHLLTVSWVGHPSVKYTTGGVVCALWLVGYVRGALGNRLQHLVSKGPLA